MMIEIKYGGSGDTKTKFLEVVREHITKIVIEESLQHLSEVESKNLEMAQDTVIRGRSARVATTIDSNLVMSLINEVLYHRSERCKVSEFALGEPDEFLLSSSLMDKMSSESREEAAVKTELDREIEVLAMREPEVPAVAKIPKMKKTRFKTKVKAKETWLEHPRNRAALVIFLLMFIGGIVAVFVL